MNNKLVAFNSRILLFTGGTAANSFTSELHKLTHALTYIIPISDNGGSTGEIQKFIGGPAIGDIRSRLIRLAEDSPMKKILEFRLPKKDEKDDKGVILDAFTVWNSLLSMKHDLWADVPTKYRHIVRAGLNTFNSALQRNIDTNKQFDYFKGSIGNFFFSGERMHYGSLSATIEVFKHVLGINTQTRVVPVVDLNKRLTLLAELTKGEPILGQDNISHPSNGTDINKDDSSPINSKVRELKYIDKDHKSFTPDICEDVLPEIASAASIVYSIGSFYTSILPNLILPGVGETVSDNTGKKIFVLNGSNDRETMYIDDNGKKHSMTAIEILEELRRGLNRYGALSNSLSDYVTDIIYLESGGIEVDVAILEKMGIRIHAVASDEDPQYYKPEALSESIYSISN